MSTWSSILYQDPNSFNMKYLMTFHDFSMIIMTMIIIIITYLFIIMMINSLSDRLLLHNNLLEINWTIIPMITIIWLAIPSLKILYMMEDFTNPILSIKAIGHQWYWSYEYANFKNIYFDSFMINSKSPNLFRLLDVDNRMMVPHNSTIRILTSSLDVIHSWTIPSMGIKMDATPGRVNQLLVKLIRPGIYFGQCSEICGMNHSFMPISIESTDSSMFMIWLKNFTNFIWS